MIRQALAMLAILVAGPAYALDISAGIDCQLTVPYPGGKLIDYDFVPVTGHIGPPTSGPLTGPTGIHYTSSGTLSSLDPSGNCCSNWTWGRNPPSPTTGPDIFHLWPNGSSGPQTWMIIIVTVEHEGRTEVIANMAHEKVLVGHGKCTGKLSS